MAKALVTEAYADHPRTWARLNVAANAQLDEVADALANALPDRHTPGAADGRRYMNEQGTVIRIDCGYDFHFAECRERWDCPGEVAWYVRPNA